MPFVELYAATKKSDTGITGLNIVRFDRFTPRMIDIDSRLIFGTSSLKYKVETGTDILVLRPFIANPDVSYWLNPIIKTFPATVRIDNTTKNTGIAYLRRSSQRGISIVGVFFCANRQKISLEALYPFEEIVSTFFPNGPVGQAKLLQ